MLSDENITEYYQSALNSDNLKVVADQRGDADYLIAAGMSKNAIGGLFLALQSEWDGAAKPRGYTAQDVERIAREMPKVTLKKVKQSGSRVFAEKKTEVFDYIGAKALLKNHYQQEMRVVGLRLRSYVGARDVLRNRLIAWGLDYAAASNVAQDVLAYWVDSVCKDCGGTKFELVEGTLRQSAKVCRTCHGSGKMPAPHGENGKRLLAWIDSAKGAGFDKQKRLLIN